MIDGADQLPELIEKLQAADDHDRYVGELAEVLFTRLRSLHGLPDDYLPVVQAGGQLHEIGLREGVKKHHLRGRDLILQTAGPAPSLAARLVALMARFHRKRPKLEAEPLLKQLEPEQRDTALKLAALVRLADGLDYTHDQATRIVDFEQTLQSATLLVDSEAGNEALNIQRATDKADLWNRLAPVRLELEDVSAHRKSQKQVVLMAPTDAMAEAGRKVMLYNLEECLSFEAGTRAGEDVEQLHRMRVATRRLRAAFRVFGKYFPAESLTSFLLELKWLADALGDVRDRDVLIEFLEAAARSATEKDRPALDRLLGVRRMRRAEAHERLLEVLDSERYQQFVGAFRSFLSDPLNAPVPDGPTVVEAAPKVIRKRLKQLGQHRRTAPYADSDELHEIRIRCKRLRYAAEFFDPSFDRALRGLIKQCVKMQDALGSVHDADVYTDVLKRYSDRLLTAKEARRSEHPVIERLIDDIEGWRQSNLAGFWAVWPKVAGRKKALRKWRTVLDELRSSYATDDVR